jgi:putative ABC transport system permease protein
MPEASREVRSRLINRLLHLLHYIPQLLRRLISRLRRSRFEREMEEEMRFHLELQIEQNLKAGMPPEDARLAAHRRFGNQTWLKEASREMWSINSIETLIQDLRYGLRMLLKHPGFTAVAILTLTLGIGANAAIFSVVSGVLLRPLPYRNPGELVLIRYLNKADGTQNQSISYPDFQDWKAQNSVFADLATFRQHSFSLAVESDLQQINAATVSANFFSLLGVNPQRGRTFLPAEERAAGGRVAMLSHGLWQSRFGGDEKVIGREIELSDQLYTVIGILPPDFKFPFRLEQAEVWTTNAPIPDGMMTRGARNFRALARLKPGVSPATAEAEIAALSARLEQANPKTNRNASVVLVGMQDLLTKDIRSTLWLLLGAVGFVLLIACANVANLFLARALAREKELAVRAALGAGRWRIARQLLTESLLLSLTGGALGLLLAAWGVPLLLALSPPNLPRINEVGLNAQVLGFTFIVAVMTGIFFGLVPAWKAAGPSLPDLNAVLKEGGRRSASAGSKRLRSALVVGEIAIALLLLIGAGLLIKSFIRLNRVELGFNPENTLIARLSLPAKNYLSGAEKIAFVRRLQEEIKNLPGVRSVSFASFLPFDGKGYSSFNIKGRELQEFTLQSMPGLNFVMPDYFATMGMRILQGRAFTDADDFRGAGAVIVNEAFVREYFPQGNPLGQQISQFGNRTPDAPQEYEIVGIVNDLKDVALERESDPEIYVPYLQVPQSFGALTIRTEPEPLNLAVPVRQLIRSLDAEQTVPRMNTIENLIAETILPHRFNLLLLGIFAIVGLLLTAVGIYGVMSYHVAGSTHEFGIRMAVGAQSRDVLRLVLGQGMKLALIGVALGVGGALALTRLLKTMLFEVSPADPATFAAIMLLLISIALLACWLPARRATKVDPLAALRVE